jgi:hypothetical protein
VIGSAAGGLGALCLHSDTVQAFARAAWESKARRTNVGAEQPLKEETPSTAHGPRLRMDPRVAAP